MARKTIEVEVLREIANRHIACALTDESRVATAVLLETVLHCTGNYKGFSYLDGHEAVIAGEYNDTARFYF